MKKSFVFVSVFISLFFFSCKNQFSENTGSESNPLISTSRSASLDFIFNNQTLGKTTITIKRSQWRKLCEDYRYFFKNENCVQAESYQYEKDGKTWTFNKGIGFRLRGNTSRFCPQGYDNGRLQGQMNKDWSADYYEYAENQPKGKDGDYRQSHFKVDFEEFLEDGEEQKMSSCIKGLALKRLDNWCGKEIFCYDLFHKNGIWTAPRACHTRLIINIIEDEDDEENAAAEGDEQTQGDQEVTIVDYGVYEMFEEVNKQALKARDKDENKSSSAWKNSKGNLWKCCNDLTTGRMYETGIEDIRIIYQGDEVPAGMQTNGREDDQRIGYVWKSCSLDLKTNKDNLASAKAELAAFINELNALPEVPFDAYKPDDSVETAYASEIAVIKAFYEKWFDVDFFLKTYAINITCGMDDDYWGNANNYYLYFDTGSKGTGKVYFIPFDYDNTLDASINGDKEGFKHNPLDWGRGADRPLIDRLLSVPEYRKKFSNFLLEVTAEDSLWNFDRASSLFLKWGEMCTSYMQNADVDYHIGAKEFNDWGGWNPGGYHLTQKPDVYDETRNYFRYWLSGIPIPNILSIDESAEGEGLFINIDKSEIPEDAAIRTFYINGKNVADVGFSTDGETREITVSPQVFDDKWAFPYVTAGKTYKVKVEFQNTSYSTVYTSPELTVTAASGLGEIYDANNAAYTIQDNKLIFDPLPVLKYGDTVLESRWNWDKYYVMEIYTTNWGWQSWNKIDDLSLPFDFTAENVVKDKDANLMFTLYYVISNDEYGSYRYILYECDSNKSFTLK